MIASSGMSLVIAKKKRTGFMFKEFDLDDAKLKNGDRGSTSGLASSTCSCCLEYKNQKVDMGNCDMVSLCSRCCRAVTSL